MPPQLDKGMGRVGKVVIKKNASRLLCILIMCCSLSFVAVLIGGIHA